MVRQDFNILLGQLLDSSRERLLRPSDLYLPVVVKCRLDYIGKSSWCPIQRPKAPLETFMGLHSENLDAIQCVWASAARSPDVSGGVYRTVL